MKNLWRSGMILSAAGFIGGMANFVFTGMINRRFVAAESPDEFGYAAACLSVSGMLGLPVAIASFALIHYVAHFRATNDEGRLQGLLSGCRKALLHVTIGGSLLAFLLIQPLGEFWKMPRASLTIAALVTVLAGLWSGFAIALCQGMAWFKRLAVIGLIAAGLRLVVGWWLTGRAPVAESVVAATAVSSLANLMVFWWRRDLFKPGPTISPWNRDFLHYLVLAAACVGGAYCFTQGDVPVASRMVEAGQFSPQQLTAYTQANKLTTALIFVVSPLLQVMFTARSGHRSKTDRIEQMKLLAMYAFGLAAGAVTLMFTRQFVLRLLLGGESAAAEAMIPRMAWSMVFIALIQMLGMWALASRWSKLAITYGCCGLAYWLTLLLVGKNPDALLLAMLASSATAFLVLFGGWYLSFRKEFAADKQKAG